jgi:hypothetical protein
MTHYFLITSVVSLKMGLRLVMLALAPLLTGSYLAYVPLCPNSQAVPGVLAIGHLAPAGGGVNNKFGLAFAANSHVWNLTLACEDSDGDGWPNGWVR